MKVSFGHGRVLAGVCLIALLSACGGSQTGEWKQQSLALKAEGLGFMGNKAGKQSWVGSGFWVTKDVVATNAHVATRATNMVGLDDAGNKYRFTAITGLDRKGDIAFLRADRDSGRKGVVLAEHPGNPKDLRGRKIVLMSNTAGVGTATGSMFRYEGMVTNVVGDKGNEQVFHNANTAGGASGSAIFDAKSFEVVGINHSSIPGVNSKLGTASWRIAAQKEQSDKRYGTDLRDLFTLQNAVKYARVGLKRTFCLMPGQGFKVPFNAPRATDIIVGLAPEKNGQVLAMGLTRGNQVMWKGATNKGAVLPFMLKGSGPHAVIIINPKAQTQKVCGKVGIGEIAWEAGIQ